ncbi:MAG TPA: YidC/Oxa1 family membrane protein insertase, partial [Acidimicrobiia bacterium]|nr:YidC/Oxa1 family membrane protein insertase [Acidimicrobiia bacterium]
MGAIWDGFKEALAYALAFFYDVIPSYGIAIILLTVSINLLLFPLTLRQTRATRAFQAVQPEIRRIQKQYKEEPEKLQQELMRVQREAGATPGGCIVPLLVQMPILLALFQLLNDPAKYLPAES